MALVVPVRSDRRSGIRNALKDFDGRQQRQVGELLWRRRIVVFEPIDPALNLAILGLYDPRSRGFFWIDRVSESLAKQNDQKDKLASHGFTKKNPTFSQAKHVIIVSLFATKKNLIFETRNNDVLFHRHVKAN